MGFDGLWLDEAWRKLKGRRKMVRVTNGGVEMVKGGEAVCVKIG